MERDPAGRAFEASFPDTTEPSHHGLAWREPSARAYYGWALAAPSVGLPFFKAAATSPDSSVNITSPPRIRASLQRSIGTRACPPIRFPPKSTRRFPFGRLHPQWFSVPQLPALQLRWEALPNLVAPTELMHQSESVARRIFHQRP